MKLLYILLLSCILIEFGCINRQDKITNENADPIDQTIYFVNADINNDGEIDKVEVIEKADSSRFIQVAIKNNDIYNIISSNHEIIDCKTCGKQNRDPFFSLTGLPGGFELTMENGQFSFFYYADSIYLYEMNLLKTHPAEKYSFTQIGKINLVDLKKGFELTIKDKIEHDELINKKSKETGCISLATVMNDEPSDYSLASLWVKPTDDKKNIQDLMSYYIKNELAIDKKGDLLSLINYTNRYFGVTTARDNEFILYFALEEERSYLIQAIKIKDEINRDPDKIKSVFNTYKYLLYSTLCKDLYNKTGVGNLVDLLILTY